MARHHEFSFHWGQCWNGQWLSPLQRGWYPYFQWMAFRNLEAMYASSISVTTETRNTEDPISCPEYLRWKYLMKYWKRPFILFIPWQFFSLNYPVTSNDNEQKSKLILQLICNKILTSYIYKCVLIYLTAYTNYKTEISSLYSDKSTSKPFPAQNHQKQNGAPLQSIKGQHSIII